MPQSFYTQYAKITDAHTDFSDFVDEIIHKYNIIEKRKNEMVCEIKYKNCEQSDDKMVQVICNNRLIAVGINRRTDFNNEEFTLIDLEHKYLKI
jgi:hypothetical protein